MFSTRMWSSHVLIFALLYVILTGFSYSKELPADKIENMLPTVVIPQGAEKAYHIAGETFCEYWQKIIGQKPDLFVYDGTQPQGDLVVIGSDAVNPLAHDVIKQGIIDGFHIRYGTDDYHVTCVEQNKQRLLLIAGGHGRAVLYAVYDFFRRCGGVEYFWDGDVFHKQGPIDFEHVNFHDSPRFEYRGLRYFAHRGLHRFRAEQWNLEDWQREIDWILKKRFNIFMLRTGIDDLFQRTFPDEVPYPPEDGLDPDEVARSHRERTSPWPLKFRGDLREKVLEYAFDRGLLHPADCGTITHWYSHTPSSFYDSFPDFPILQQSGKRDKTYPKVWDIQYQRTWDTYWKLTETSIKEYGREQARMFHTIGLAERMFGNDRRANFQLKLYGLRKTEQMVRKHYPDAPLLIGGWDFLWWIDEEVQSYLKELDPEKTIVLDYTDDDYRRKTYKNWTYGRFPWMFGLLHAFAGNTEIRGDYGLLNERIREADNDSYCKGLIYWPEISHNDTFILEYIATNSWSPQALELEFATKKFCQARYPDAISDSMFKIWNDFLKISQTSAWGKKYETRTPGFRPLDYTILTDLTDDKIKSFENKVTTYRNVLNHGPIVLKKLALMSRKNYSNKFWNRDAIDITRTIIDRAIATNSMAMAVEMEAWRKGTGHSERIHTFQKNSVNLMKVLALILGESDDYSLYHSVGKLKQTHAVNPYAEQILKANSENPYCRHHVYEMVAHLYPKELEAYFLWVNNRIEQKNKSEWKRPEEFDDIRLKIEDEYYQSPLKKMAPSQKRSADTLSSTLMDAARLLEKVNSI